LFTYLKKPLKTEEEKKKPLKIEVDDCFLNLEEHNSSKLRCFYSKFILYIYILHHSFKLSLISPNEEIVM